MYEGDKVTDAIDLMNKIIEWSIMQLYRNIEDITNRKNNKTILMFVVSSMLLTLLVMHFHTKDLGLLFGLSDCEIPRLIKMS